MAASNRPSPYSSSSSPSPSASLSSPLGESIRKLMMDPPIDASLSPSRNVRGMSDGSWCEIFPSTPPQRDEEGHEGERNEKAKAKEHEDGVVPNAEDEKSTFRKSTAILSHEEGRQDDENDASSRTSSLGAAHDSDASPSTPQLPISSPSALTWALEEHRKSFMSQHQHQNGASPHGHAVEQEGATSSASSSSFSSASKVPSPSPQRASSSAARSLASPQVGRAAARGASFAPVGSVPPPPLPSTTPSSSLTSSAASQLPSLDVEVAIRFVHPRKRRRVVVRTVIPLQRELSVNEACFDYITAAQLLRALATQGGIDLERWRVEIPDGVEAEDDDSNMSGYGVGEESGESESALSSYPPSSVPSSKQRVHYAPLLLDAVQENLSKAEVIQGGDPSQERLPLSVMWTPRGGAALRFIDIRLVARQTSASSTSSTSARDETSTSSSSLLSSDSGDAVKLGREGRAWMFGRDWNKTAHFRPFLLKDFSVVDISCGTSHFLALTKEGRVFSWGSGKFGKLGHGHSLEDIMAPTLIQSIYRHQITKIAAGPRHSVALTDRGQILVWGQTTLSDDCHVEDVTNPKFVKMSALQGITFKNISTAGNHIAAVSMIGRPYYWAWSSETSLVEPFPAKVIAGMEDIVVTDICSSKKFIAMITGMELYTQVLQDKAEELPQYAWSRYNKVLGNTSEDDKRAYRARKLYKEDVTKVRQIACNSNSLTALLESGEIVIIDVLESNSVTLSFLNDKSIIQIACGQNHLVALSDSGLVYSWGMDNHGALGHGKVQQKQPLAIKALDEILVQKVICNKSCTIVLEDYWATQLLRTMAGMKGVMRDDIHQLRSYTYQSPKDQILPSLHLAYQCHHSRYTSQNAKMLGWLFWSNNYTLKLGVSSVSLEFNSRERQPGVYDEKLTLTNQSKQELKLAVALCHREKERRYTIAIDPIPEVLAAGKSFDLTVRLYVVEPIAVNAMIDIIVNETSHYIVLIKLEKEHFIRPLGDILASSSDMVTDAPSLALSQMSFSSLTGLKNSYADIYDQEDGLLVFVLQPTTSFSRKKSTPLRPSSATTAAQPTSPINGSLSAAAAVPPSYVGSVVAESLHMSMASVPRHHRRSGSGVMLSSDSLPVERVSRLGDSQVSPAHSSLSSEVITIDFKHDEIEFHEELGRGASGAVVYACSIKGLFFAAKILDSSTFPSDEQVQRMLSEISIMAQLRHENVVRLLAYDYREDKREIRMYTQLYPETLWQVISNRASKGKPFSCKEVIEFSFQIARGLHYLGRQDPPIVHRDLKSDNIFVSWDNHRQPRRLHIGDFDTSKVMQTTGAKTFTQVGTPGWMAPEVFSESGRGHDVKADVWSFGMVLYELIVMKQPYFDKNHFEISNCNIKGIRPTVPDSVDKEAYKDLLKLFHKCTNKRPQDRPSTADILATLAAM